MSLIGKLKNVNLGDVILLECINKMGSSVVGFVLELKDNEVTLSTQQHYYLKEREIRIQEFKLCGGSPTTFFSGDRKYSLEYFDNYEILKPYKGERILKKLIEDEPY